MFEVEIWGRLGDGRRRLPPWHPKCSTGKRNAVGQTVAQVDMGLPEGVRPQFDVVAIVAHFPPVYAVI